VGERVEWSLTLPNPHTYYLQISKNSIVNRIPSHFPMIFCNVIINVVYSLQYFYIHYEAYYTFEQIRFA